MKQQIDEALVDNKATKICDRIRAARAERRERRWDARVCLRIKRNWHFVGRMALRFTWWCCWLPWIRAGYSLQTGACGGWPRLVRLRRGLSRHEKF